MQTDMHYYGTYAIARAAGVKSEFAEKIATAAQFVDDSDTVGTLLQDGRYLHCPATGHHPIDKDNIDPRDQRDVWIPFHFLPGNEGGTFAERLVCVQDSDVAKRILEFATKNAGLRYGPMLVGVVAHVYADTFSHYGFSGISDVANQVDIDSINISSIENAQIRDYVVTKAQKFFVKFGASVANAVMLGHGGVATYPDRPYLRWNFKYSDGRESGERNNPATFLAACERLHHFFSQVADMHPKYASISDRRVFEEIRSEIASVLATESEMDGRISAWRCAMNSGKILGYAEDIPEYNQKRFDQEASEFGLMSTADVEKLEAFQFLEAARAYRFYSLYELLPSNGIHVIVPAPTAGEKSYGELVAVTA